MKQSRRLISLFLRCINAAYVHTKGGGDYAVQGEFPNAYLLFEWSDGRDDWQNNLAFSAKTINPQEPKDQQWRVHRGFLKVWQAMRIEVVDRIAELIHIYHFKKIICVGYSHGAALALLATEDLSRIFGKQITVEGYGFGSPRVVWGKLPDDVQARLVNFHTIRNIPDLVTHLPPAAWGFRHVNLTEIGEKGKYGPIKAHTSQAYINELGRNQNPEPVDPSTRMAVAGTLGR